MYLGVSEYHEDRGEYIRHRALWNDDDRTQSQEVIFMNADERKSKASARC
jgi:hypothetical protein